MSRTTGIRTRHGRGCKTRDGGQCNCSPTYEAWVYSKRDRKKIRRSFPTHAAAVGWRTDARKAVKDRKLRGPTSRTLRQEVDEWLEGARAGRILNKREHPYKPGVVRNYELSLRLRVLPELGDRKLDSIDLADLLELKERLIGEGCSASTVRNTFVPVQAIYRRARLGERVAIDPTIDLPLPTAGVRDRAATPQQAAEVIEPLAELERALWATAFYAGLRRGEMRGLRPRDIDLEAGVVTVERGWDEKEGPIAPKSRAGVRRVFLLKALRPFIEPLVGRADDPDGLLFGYGTATPFDPRAVARKAERAWAAADAKMAEDDLQPLATFTLHEARHSFSTWLDHAGVSPDRADRYMGHSTASRVPGRYRHLLPGQMAEDAKTLDSWLAGGTAGKVVQLAAAQ
jgi:integrase